MSKALARPNIAQLVERSTVEIAAIEWSLVRFRVFGFSGNIRRCGMVLSLELESEYAASLV
jgi:hypothetical protein